MQRKGTIQPGKDCGECWSSRLLRKVSSIVARAACHLCLVCAQAGERAVVGRATSAESNSCERSGRALSWRLSGLRISSEPRLERRLSRRKICGLITSLRIALCGSELLKLQDYRHCWAVNSESIQEVLSSSILGVQVTDFGYLLDREDLPLVSRQPHFWKGE